MTNLSECSLQWLLKQLGMSACSPERSGSPASPRNPSISPASLSSRTSSALRPDSAIQVHLIM
eukprot:3886108-Karenia_brevis.AAC.1